MDSFKNSGFKVYVNFQADVKNTQFGVSTVRRKDIHLKADYPKENYFAL